MSWFAGDRPRQNGSRNSGRGGRRPRGRQSAQQSRKDGRHMAQTMAMMQDTTQLQSQVVFLEQVKAALSVGHVHLEAIASGAPPESLSATASGLVACLNLARMTALERQDDRQGLDAAKAAVARFDEEVNRKYAGLRAQELRNRVDDVKGALCAHLVSVLHGDADVPVMGVAPFVPSGERTAEQSVSAGMSEFMRGTHRVGELREDVAKNSGKYRRALEAEARMGAQYGTGEGQGNFADRGVEILQADMSSVGELRDARETERQARHELEVLVAAQRAREEMSFGSFEGAPDLTTVRANELGGGRCGHGRHGGAGHGEVQDEDGDHAMEQAPARGGEDRARWW